MRDKRSECPLLSAEYALGSDEPVRLLGNACRGLSSGFEPPLHTPCDQVTDCCFTFPISLVLP